jgi:hypothetical protein
MLTVNGATHAGGVGGRGATANSGNSGGGGGSGGAILLESPSVTLNAGATLVANGGEGGEGSRSQVGGNASDGLEAITRTPGGTGNNGDDGGDGAAAGGGGGVGRIRITAFGSCQRNVTTVSPAASVMGCQQRSHEIGDIGRLVHHAAVLKSADMGEVRDPGGVLRG